MDNAVREPVRVTRSFEADAARVFDAWLDDATVGDWLFATPDGELRRVALDPRVGGGFTITERRDDTDVEHVGLWLELTRPHRLQFAFAVPRFAPEPTRVVVDVVAVPGGSSVVLTHADVLAGYADRTRHGWIAILDGLARSLAR